MITQCDKCNNQFDLDAIKRDHVKLYADIERHYIECPHCKEQYTTHYVNDEIKRMQEQLKTLQKKSQLKLKQKNRITKLKQKIIFTHRQVKMQVENPTEKAVQNSVGKGGE